MTAVIIVVVIAVGLPLLAWWVARRPFWTDHRARTDRDLWSAVLAAHDITGYEMHRAAQAIGWSWSPPEDPRLRAAVADWAARELRAEQEARASSGRRALVLSGAALGLLAGAFVVLRAVSGTAGTVDTLLGAGVLGLVLAVPAQSLERARLRRLASGGPPRRGAP